MDVHELKQWAKNRGQRITRLADALLADVNIFPYAFELMTTFVNAVQFRDTVLLNSPDFLHELLLSSASSDIEHDRVKSLCVTVLSQPLPDQVRLPAAVQPFLNNLLASFNKTPTLLKLEDLYAVLDSDCCSVLLKIPQPSIEEARRHLTLIVKTSTTVQDQLYAVTSIAVLAKFYEAFESETCVVFETPTRKQSIVKSPSELETPIFRELIRFFSGDRAPLTLSIVSRQVLYVCVNQNQETVDSLSKRLRRALQAVELVGSSYKSTFGQTYSQIIRKIHEKIAKEEMNPSICTLAAAFMASMSKSIPPDTTVRAFEQALLQHTSPQVHMRFISDAVAISLPILAPQLSSQFWKSLCLRIIESLLIPANDVSASSLDVEQSLDIIMRMSNLESAAQASFLEAMRNEDMQAKMSSFCSSPLRQGIYLDYEMIFSSNVLKMLLANHCTSNEYQCTLSKVIFDRYQRSVVRSRVSNPHNARSSNSILVTPRISIKEPGTSTNWRERLQRQFQTEAQQSGERVVELIGNICHDLETRCDSIEQPLKEQQTRFADLQDKYDTIEQTSADWEQKFSEQGAMLKRRELKVEQLEQSLKTVIDHAEKIEKESASRLQQMQDDMNENKQRDLKSRNAYEHAEFELRTEMACQVERFNDQYRQLQSLKEDDTRMHDKLHEEKGQRNTLELSHGILIKKLELQAESAIKTREANEEQIAQASLRNTVLEEQVQLKQKELALSIRDNEQSTARWESEIAISREAIRSMALAHATRLSSIEETTTETERSLNRELSILQTQHMQAQQIACEESRIKGNQILRLQQRLGISSKEYEKIKIQLEEAEAAKGNILRNLGAMVNGQVISKTDPLQLDNPTSKQVVDISSTQSNMVNMTSLSSSPEKAPSKSFTSEASSSNHEPMPKRARPRVPSKATQSRRTLIKSDSRNERRATTFAQEISSREPLVEASSDNLDNQQNATRRHSELPFRTNPDVNVTPKGQPISIPKNPVVLSAIPSEDFGSTIFDSSLYVEQENKELPVDNNNTELYDMVVDDFEVSTVEL